MPVYEYRCAGCGKITEVVCGVSEMQTRVPCGQCGEPADQIISRTSVHRSKASKLDRLDPKYDRMVDNAMATTQNAEPDQILKRMKPFPKDGT